MVDNKTISIHDMGRGGIAILEAEIVRLQAECAELRWALEGTTRMLEERSSNQSRFSTWMREVVVANREVLSKYPDRAKKSGEFSP